MKIEVNNFDLKGTLLSGQCFRVTEENDGSFTVILFDRVINVKQDNDILTVSSNNMDNIVEIVVNYLDLNRDYNKINNELMVDSVMEECINKCQGYRIMNQDPFEMCISYIISQNNNVKRISDSINKLCELRGKKAKFNNKEYYLFPAYEELKDISLEELRSTGIGFRDKYIKNFLDNYLEISDIGNLTTENALNELMKIKGIGLKVASCILLFGYSRLDVFPIDTWVKHFISKKYDVKNDQKAIEKLAREKFGEYSGIAIQYMFHSERNIK